MAATLLVVHPDKALCEAMRAYAIGAQVVGRTTAAEGLNTFQSLQPAVIVCAARLPDQEGTWLVTKVRSQARPLRDTPILMLVPQSEDAFRIEVLQAGVDVVVREPIGANELVVRVKALVALVARASGEASSSRKSRSTRGQLDARSPMSGAIESGRVALLLKTFEDQRASGKLSIGRTSTARQRLVLNIVAGKVTNGRAPGEELTAEDAVDAAMRWPSGHFDFSPEDGTAQTPRDYPPTTKKGVTSSRSGTAWKTPDTATIRSPPPAMRMNRYETLPSQPIVYTGESKSRRPPSVRVETTEDRLAKK